MCLYLVCLPLNAIKLGNFGSALKIVAAFPIVLGIMSGYIKQNSVLRSQLLFTLFAALSFVWSFSFDASLNRVISYFELLALLYSCACFSYTANEIRIIKMALVWSSRITAIVMLLFAGYVEERLWLTGVLNEDPNYICAYFSFGVVFAIQRIISDESLWRKVVCIIELLSYMYIILSTGSRGGLFSVGISILSYILISFGKGNGRRFIGILVSGIIILLGFNYLMDILPYALRMRFTLNTILADGGSGRTEIWLNGLDLYAKSSPFRWLCGYGTATTRLLFGYYNYSQVNVMHNMFLETLLELGVIGLGLYSTAIFKFTKWSLKIEDKFSFSIIICMIMMSLTVSIYTFKPYFNIMGFIIVCNCSNIDDLIENH